MYRGFSTSPPSSAMYSAGIQLKTQTSPYIIPSWSSSSVVLPRGGSRDHPLCSSDFKNLKPTTTTRFADGLSPRIILRCNSSTRPGPPAPGENESKKVLDAFFLGKALAEALSERIESTVGEFLSTVGRLQAEQQKQVQDLQEEVMERARRAKEKAAREAMEAQGLITPKSSKENVVDGVASVTTTATSADEALVAPISPSSPNSGPSKVETDPNNTEEDFLYGVSKDD